ncbi:MAG: hypothetical protein JKY17_03920 [Magnetovibrio sp.]|nr:hypothetical protein [Magnetovibrio sp.]
MVLKKRSFNSQGTLSPDLTRNKGLHGYRFGAGALIWEEKRPTKAGTPPSDAPFSDRTKVRHASLYRHIWADKRAGGRLYLHVRQWGKKRHKRRHNCPLDHSKDRDLNKKTNGLVRPNFLKGTDFTKLTVTDM